MASPDPRPVVLVAIDWYLPAYRAGGPIRSVANLVAALGDDLDFRIVCGDRDLGAADLLPVEMDQWQPHGKASILYLPGHSGRPAAGRRSSEKSSRTDST